MSSTSPNYLWRLKKKHKKDVCFVCLLLLLLPLSGRAATGASVSCSSFTTDTYWASTASPTWIFIHMADIVLLRKTILTLHVNMVELASFSVGFLLLILLQQVLSF